MKTHDLIQGSDAWHAYRAEHDNASDAPAMMGCSPYKTRSQLLHERHTGLTADVDAATQRRFDDGHRYEALARPLAEAIIGQDLYPATGSNGRLSASFDGLTADDSIVFEHKSLNSELRAIMPSVEMLEYEAANAIIPMQYRVQMEQQCMVSGAKQVLFMASKWEGDNLVESRHCWYESDAELADAIRAGWEQFHKDEADYVPPAAAALVVAAPVQALPAVTVRVDGSISVIDNFAVFEVALRDFLEHRLIRKPESDQDFADLDVQIKALKGAEAALDSAETQMLAQIQSVDQAKKTKDMLGKLVRENRLMAEKLLASEKERRRGEIVADGVRLLREHIEGLNARIGERYMPVIPADFGAAIKGKRDLANMEDAVATELARAKIAANEVADRIQINMQALVAAGDTASFPDAATLVLKASDDLRAIIAQRVAEVERKNEEARARIRKEEQDRLAREAEAAALAATKAATPEPAAAPTTPAPTPAANVVPMRAAAAPAPAAPPATPPTLKLGDINALLSPISLTAEGLVKLGFPHAATDKSAKLYHARDLTHICAALHDLLDQVQAKQAA